MDSRVKHGNDRKGNVSRPCAPFFSSLGELVRVGEFKICIRCSVAVVYVFID